MSPDDWNFSHRCHSERAQHAERCTGTVQLEATMMWCEQASRNQREGEELIRKAQQYMREIKAHAKKNAAAAEDAQQQLAGAKEALQKRSDLCCGTAVLSDAQGIMSAFRAGEQSLPGKGSLSMRRRLEDCVSLLSRDEELASSSVRTESAEESARTAQLEATQAQAALNEVHLCVLICPLSTGLCPCTFKQAVHAHPHTRAFV